MALNGMPKNAEVSNVLRLAGVPPVAAAAVTIWLKFALAASVGVRKEFRLYERCDQPIVCDARRGEQALTDR